MRKTLLAIAAGTALMAATAVNAQGYAGAGAGPARIDIDCGGATTCDKSSTGYKLYGGYQFSGGLAVEGVYFNWGKAKASGDVLLGGPTPVTGEGRVKADGFGAGVAYFFPLAPDWVPVVRAGIVRNTAKTTASALGLSQTETFHNTTGYIGVGIGYMVTRNLALTGELDFSKVKYTDSDKANTRLLTLGVRYSF
jgi:OmpA-OmpF porin, OOP family